MNRPIKVGVVGIGRGRSFAQSALDTVGMKLVALCDTWKSKLKETGKQYHVATYTDYNRFLEHDMDAVILANFFHEHAPFAIKALAAGKHVMSETSPAKTLGECVALCRAVERSGKTYMFAENYPYTAFNQEMRRLYREGEIGRVVYAEGEYNHPMELESRLRLSPGINHWRNWMPAPYYCSHALAPLMVITDTMPTSVNALSVAAPELNEHTARIADSGMAMMCRMDNDAVFRIFGLMVPGHSNWYRFHGTHGAMEIARGPGYFGPEQVRVWHDDWDRKPGVPTERVYKPGNWPEHGDLAGKAGHGGGDFWTTFHFANAIRARKQPYLDVYRGVAMAATGIQGWRSCLDQGRPYPIPDFAKESARKPYENDNWSPFAEDAGPGQPPPSIHGLLRPKPKAIAHAKRVWKSMGYDTSA